MVVVVVTALTMMIVVTLYCDNAIDVAYSLICIMSGCGHLYILDNIVNS